MHPVETVGISFTPNSMTLACIGNETKGQKLHHIFEINGNETQRNIALKETVAKLNLQGATTKILLPKEDYQIFLMEQPKVLVNEQHDAVRWQIAEYIEYPVEEAVVDFIELPQKVNPEENPQMIYTVVSRKSKINEIVADIQSAGLKVKAVDICESALKQIAMKVGDEDEGQALLHFEEEKSYLLIFKKKILYMMRDLDIGLKNLNLSADQARQDSQQIAHDLSLEIQRSLDYCASNLKNASVNRIILTPLNVKAPHFLSNLSNNLGLPVREMEFSEFLNASSTIQKESATTFAIGAALNETLP